MECVGCERTLTPAAVREFLQDGKKVHDHKYVLIRIRCPFCQHTTQRRQGTSSGVPVGTIRRGSRRGAG